MRIILSFWKYNLLSAMEYRFSFLAQIAFMFLNDLVFLFIWWGFFQVFPTIRWIGFQEFIPLLSLFVMIFAIMHIFLGGYQNVPSLISNGGLDNHLLLPGDPLPRILASKLDVSAIGDLLYALALLFLLDDPFRFVLPLIGYATVGALIFTGFMTMTGSFSFAIGNSERLNQACFDGVLGPSHYPPGIFDGSFLKIVFMTVFPVYFIAFLPYELLFHFSVEKFAILLAALVAFASLGYWTFTLGLRRYESGNLVTTNQ